jgi:2-polyprenyl-6-methoxyphenol hydroxylase-like FAD-dependent oxidoreductase
VFGQFPLEVKRTVEFLEGHDERIHHSPLEEVRLPTWGTNRIVLIGDAAHATAPVWAQGAALAFEDANALSSMLGANKDWTNISASFQAKRSERVSHIQTMTDKMSKVSRLPASIRNLLMPFFGPRSYRTTYGPLRPPI